MHPPTASVPQGAPPALGPGRPLSRDIRRLQERLFELQCEPEPDVGAINRLMRELARVRERQG